MKDQHDSFLHLLSNIFLLKTNSYVENSALSALFPVDCLQIENKIMVSKGVSLRASTGFPMFYFVHALGYGQEHPFNNDP